MEKRVKLLGALLGAQLLLALAALGVGAGDPPAARPLLAIEAEAVDRITLEGPGQARVVLARGEGGWRLPDAGDFPADAARVEDLLERLAGLRAGEPVATTAAARERFRVADADFERRITLAQGEREVRLYLGTSPGLRRVHARAGDADAIQVVELAAHELPVTAPGWEDKALLAVPRDEIAGIEVAGLRLRRQPPAAGAESTAPGWLAEGAGETRLRPQAADALAGRLAALRFDAVLGQQPPAGYDPERPALALTVNRRDGAPVEYRLGKAKEGDDYILKVSTRPEYFRLAAHAAGPLLEAAGRDALLDGAKPAQQEQAEGGSDRAPPSA